MAEIAVSDSDGAVPRKPSGGRPTRKGIEERTKRIIDVATRLFINSGYADTTLDAIAKNAAVAKRTLYNEYGDKGTLFAAVVRARVAQAIVPKLKLRTERLAPGEVLLELARGLLELCTAPETIELQRLMIGEVKRFPDLIGAIMRESLDDLYSDISAVLEQLREEERLEFTDEPRAAARRFTDIIVGMSSLHATLGVTFTLPDDEELHFRVRMFELTCCRSAL